MRYLLSRTLAQRSVVEGCRRLVAVSLHHNMAHDGSGTGGSLVAVAQMTSTADKEKNFDTCAELVSEAARAGAKMVFLPEGCDYIAESKEQSLSQAESLSGPLVARYRELAQTHGVWLSLGGIHIKESGEDKLSNTHLLLDPAGVEVSRYTKTHLFSVHIPDRGLHLQEDAYVAAGSAIHPPTPTPVGNLALGICYDLRFAEFSLLHRRLGADVLTFPSAFTVTTGLAHWEALLRARAIETQCYVVAAAQTGQHNRKRSSYGHAMIVDPWGAVVGQASEGTGLVLARVNLGYLRNLRREMPIMLHRRQDLYHISQPRHSHLPSLAPSMLPRESLGYVSHQFGSVQVPGLCVFLRSPQSLAFVNKKPFTPGHVLLCPERPAAHLADLTPAELSDLAQLTQATIKVIDDHYSPPGHPSVQMAIQDGPAAGQTIEGGEEGEVEGRLQGHEEEGGRRWREQGEMEEEARQLRETVKGMITSLVPQDPTLPRMLEVVEVEEDGEVQVGEVSVPCKAVFARTCHSCAFVAPDPVLPGHVYVVSLEGVEGGGGYGGVEVDRAVDLLLVTQLVEGLVKRVIEAEASTVVLFSDSREGQHLQIQIIPRRSDDLPSNDDIYKAVFKHQTGAPDWSFTEETFSLASQLREEAKIQGEEER